MNTTPLPLGRFVLGVAILLAGPPINAQTNIAANGMADHATDRAAPIPMDQLAAMAGKQYQGDGLSIGATAEGARLRCLFQRLEGQATPEGLWLESTVPGAPGRLRLTATAVGREVLECGGPPLLWNEPASTESGRGLPHSTTLARCVPRLCLPGGCALPVTGKVSVADQLVKGSVNEIVMLCLRQEEW